MKNLIASLLFLFGPYALAEYKIGINVGYSSNYTLAQDMVTMSGGVPMKIEAKVEFESSIELGLDFWNSTQNSWGLISGISWTPDRKAKSASVNGTSVPVSDAKMASTFIYLGTHYRWESFYIPLGLTYSINRFTPDASSTADHEIKNGVGALVGLGWFIGDRFALDLIGKSSVVDVETKQNGAIETEKGTISTGTFSLRYFF